MVMEGEGAWRAVEWSPDDTQLLVSNYISVNESYIWILDLATGEKTQINPADINISYGGLSWGPQGKSVYYTSDEGGEFRQLTHDNLDSGEKTLLTGGIPWDIAGFELSHKGDLLALVINEGGIFRIDLRRAEYGDERIPEMRAFLSSISPNTRAHQITKPMFIAAGLNDPRVPASESAQMVDVMRQNGQQVWYMLAKDEGHGFRKKSNSDFFREATVLFWQTHLLD